MTEKRYLNYEVRAFAHRRERGGELAYEEVPDEQADLFCIYGKVGIFQWEWVEDVPDRAYGEYWIDRYGRRPA